MNFNEKEKYVICESSVTANNLARIILGLCGMSPILIPANKNDIKIGGRMAVRVDVSDIPIRTVDEAIKTMDYKVV